MPQCSGLVELNLHSAQSVQCMQRARLGGSLASKAHLQMSSLEARPQICYIMNVCSPNFCTTCTYSTVQYSLVYCQPVKIAILVSVAVCTREQQETYVSRHVSQLTREIIKKKTQGHLEFKSIVRHELIAQVATACSQIDTRYCWQTQYTQRNCL